MKAFMILLTLLLSFSCTKHAELSKDALGVHVKNVHMDISHLNEIEWLVGKHKEEKISQSFTFILDMPRLKVEEYEYLSEHKNIDAWIIRLIVVRGSKSQDLGSLHTVFKPRKISRGISGGAATSVSLKVYYAAAYASEKFRAFRCPAFGHNKRISGIAVAGENTPFEISVDETSYYGEKSQLVELTPSSFNGGLSLVGEYYLEIAPYDSSKKMIHSSFKRIPRSIVVTSEKEVSVRSCEGVKSEIQE